MARRYSRAASKDVKGAMRKRARHVKERTEWQEGHEPQAGNCDRPFRSPQQRQESSTAEVGRIGRWWMRHFPNEGTSHDHITQALTIICQAC